MDERDAPGDQMTDVATLIPYTRFLEVRARRLGDARCALNGDGAVACIGRILAAPLS